MILVHVPVVQLPPLRHLLDDVLDGSLLSSLRLSSICLGVSGGGSVRAGGGPYLRGTFIVCDFRALHFFFFGFALTSDAPEEFQLETELIGMLFTATLEGLKVIFRYLN